MVGIIKVIYIYVISLSVIYYTARPKKGDFVPGNAYIVEFKCAYQYTLLVKEYQKKAWQPYSRFLHPLEVCIVINQYQAYSVIFLWLNAYMQNHGKENIHFELDLHIISDTLDWTSEGWAMPRSVKFCLLWLKWFTYLQVHHFSCEMTYNNQLKDNLNYFEEMYSVYYTYKKSFDHLILVYPFGRKETNIFNNWF